MLMFPTSNMRLVLTRCSRCDAVTSSPFYTTALYEYIDADEPFCEAECAAIEYANRNAAN
jgi:hypothetical protein